MKTIDIDATVTRLGRRTVKPSPRRKPRIVKQPRGSRAPQPAPEPPPAAPEPAPSASKPDAAEAAEMRFLARLGGIVLAFRKSKGLERSQLAADAGICERTVQLVERGEHAATATTLRGLERGLGLRPGLLMTMAK